MLSNRLLILSPTLSGSKKTKIWNYQISNLDFFANQFQMLFWKIQLGFKTL